MLNEQTREQEILEYLPLVEKVVKGLKVKSHAFDYDDLYQFGVIGLMDALGKYDHTKKVPFESYAYTRIRGAIIDEVRKSSPVTRTGMDKLKSYYRVKEELENEFQRPAKESEIAEKLDLAQKDLSGVYETSGSVLSDFIEDDRVLSFDETLLHEEQVEKLQEAVASLSEREQQILQLIYVEKLALKEIAYVFDISIPRVSQIHGKCVSSLRDYLRRNYRD
jgi:RNA polymerase sigma factor for flagellar operon FliA